MGSLLIIATSYVWIESVIIYYRLALFELNSCAIVSGGKDIPSEWPKKIYICIYIYYLYVDFDDDAPRIPARMAGGGKTFPPEWPKKKVSDTYVDSEVSFAKEPYKRDYILQKGPIILRSLLIVATPCHYSLWMMYVYGLYMCI